jgi:hypothetical protein
MTLEQAQQLFDLLVGVVIPVLVSRIKLVEWPSQWKFGLVFAMSLLASAVVPVATISNEGFDWQRMLDSLVLIFTTTQVVYHSAFKLLDTETQLNPRVALLRLIKEQVAFYVASLDDKDVAEILDPESDRGLSVIFDDVTLTNED